MSNGGLQLDQCLMHMFNMLGFTWTERPNTARSSVCNWNTTGLCLAACGS